MINLSIDFEGNNMKCDAVIELDGISASWTARAKISGHPTISNLYINYRLGEYLAPLFVSEKDLQFFTSLLDKIEEQANVLLPNEHVENIKDN